MLKVQVTDDLDLGRDKESNLHDNEQLFIGGGPDSPTPPIIVLPVCYEGPLGN